MQTVYSNVRVLGFITIFIVLFSAPAFSTELKITLSHKMADGKLYIKGASNLPEGTKLGITLSSPSKQYSAQDYEIFVDRKGIFTSTGFSNRGKPLSGNFNAELISYFNRIWNSEAIINKLKVYSGPGVVSGENIEILHSFTIDSPSSTIAKAETIKNPQHSNLVHKFCYALQADLLCEKIDMRVDTEGKIEQIVGGQIRGPESKYNSDCMAGINQAFAEEKTGLCSNAWEKYGCSGTDVPRLLQESPFRKDSTVFCEY